MKTLITFFALASLTFAQEEDPLKYFPYKAGDMWEYYWDDQQYPDTLQNFNVVDSIDGEGNIFVLQSARFINPISPPALLGDSILFKIDTIYNVYGAYQSQNDLLYKLNAQQGEKWIVYEYPSGNAFEMCRVMEVREEEWFGIKTIVKVFVFYFTQDSTDTLGLVRYGDVLAKNFGLVHRGGLDAVGVITLKGCVINGILFGDTTDVITSVKDLSDNSLILFELFSNYPNPFNPTTTISFRIGNSKNISLIVYDTMGKEVKRLIDNEFYYSGIYKVVWDGRNNYNQLASSGVYYYRLIGDSINLTRSMILIK